MHNPTDRIAHTTAFVIPVVEHWLEREIAQWVSYMKYIIKINTSIRVAYQVFEIRVICIKEV